MGKNIFTVNFFGIHCSADFILLRGSTTVNSKKFDILFLEHLDRAIFDYPDQV
jgi:hypothetical protein